MSVFIRPDSKDGVYSYDFRLRGQRFSGSTGKTSRREALLVEKAAREQAAIDIISLSAEALTLEQATSRYWHEVGQHHANSATTLWSLDWLLDHFGASKLLHAITDSDVAAMVAKRRGEFVPSQRKPGRKYKSPEIRRRVSPATVNRTVTQPLREVTLRAKNLWKVRTAEIDWSRHLLKEPQERVREARPDEESAIMQELGRGYDDAVAFAFLSLCRRMEIIGLEWSRVDFFARSFTVVGKGGKSRTLPMSQPIFDLLWRQRERHATKVFTYQAARAVKMRDGRLLERGSFYPLTEHGLRTAMRRAVAGAGVADFHFHDTRHTGATRVLRKSNLRVVQLLLGHASIQTTTKYAHAMLDDLRAGLDAAAATTSATETATDGADTQAKRLKA